MVCNMAFNKKKANKVKDLIQSNAVDTFRKYRKVLLTWATGCGKTLASLKMIKAYYDAEPDIKGFIICKEKSHLGNWKNDINEHGMLFIHNITEMFLYDSLHKYHGPVDFIILDEVHALSDLRLEELLRIINPNTALIMLSATVNDLKLINIQALSRNGHVTSHISISDAIAKGILPPPKVFVHFYNLDNSVANQTYILKQGTESKRVKRQSTYYSAKEIMKKHKHLELKVLCTERQCYDLITAEMNSNKAKFINTKSHWARKKWVNMGSYRKRTMAEMKTQRAIELINKEFKGSRFICFTGSKKQCEKIGKKQFIHSDLKSSEVDKKKDAFNRGDIDELYVVNMFRESINLVNVEKGLNIQLDNVKLTFIQILGRVFRSEFPEMHLMVFKGTQDEVYFKNVIKGFDKSYIIKINH